MNLKKGNSGLDKGFINGTGDIVMNLIMFIYTWKAFIKVICIKVNINMIKFITISPVPFMKPLNFVSSSLY